MISKGDMMEEMDEKSRCELNLSPFLLNNY